MAILQSLIEPNVLTNNEIELVRVVVHISQLMETSHHLDKVKTYLHMTKGPEGNEAYDGLVALQSKIRANICEILTDVRNQPHLYSCNDDHKI